MVAVKSAYQTTTGDVAVRDGKGVIWVLKKDWLNASVSRNEQLQKAINLFIGGTLIAFERYDKDRHGVLGGGIICLSS